jgi:hypothetical protein
MNNEERIAKLEAELAALKAKSEPPEVMARKPMPKYDPTEGMRLPPSAVKAMADVYNPDVKGAGFNPNAWAQTKMSDPGWIKKPGVSAAELREAGRAEEKKQPLPKPKRPDDPGRKFAQYDALVAALVGGPNDTSKLK